MRKKVFTAVLDMLHSIYVKGMFKRAKIQDPDRYIKSDSIATSQGCRESRINLCLLQCAVYSYKSVSP